MLFHTYQYLVFFVAVFVVYWGLPWPRARVYLLLAASFAFYATWNEWLALLITGTATVDFLLARRIETARSARGRKILVLVSVAVNLGVLAYFKYANFFLDSLTAALHRVGVDSPPAHLNVIVPFGISFYTFEAISYTVDVYRGRLRAERNLVNFLLFILFFLHRRRADCPKPDFLRQVPKPSVELGPGPVSVAHRPLFSSWPSPPYGDLQDPAFGPRGTRRA